LRRRYLRLAAPSDGLATFAEITAGKSTPADLPQGANQFREIG
jgi:hypothetical protein